MVRRRNIIVVLVLLLAVAVVAWRSLGKSAGPIFETTMVSKGDMEATVAAIGTLQPRVAVEVGAQVSGQILRLHVQAGDPVEKGQLLVEIDASVHQAAVDAGRAALDRLRAQLAEEEARLRLAEQKFIRQAQLARDELAPEEELQVVEAERDAATARVRQRRAEIVERESTLKGDEALLSYSRIDAPITGTVVSLEAKEGQTINATYQTPTILRIADLKKMTVWTAVAEADIYRVKAGMPASFSTLGNDERRWNGRVRQVLPMPPLLSGNAQPAPEYGRVIQYTVLFEVDNEDRFLMPQMTALVSILTDSAHQVLIASLAGLAPIPDRPAFFQARVLEEDGQVTSRIVQTGKRNRRVAEVLDGLREGERLIVAERPPEKKKRFVW